MEKINTYPFKSVSTGQAKDIPDFFNQTIKWQFENVKTIKEIHAALIEYLKIDNPIFFLRLYGSFSKDNYDLLRRGFLTEYPNKTRMVYCDNTFSQLFSALKIAEISYNTQELYDLFNQEKLVVGFGQTSLEKELCFYTPKGAIKANLNSKGWYLAHILPVGMEYENINDLQKLFTKPTKGDRENWNPKNKIRFENENLTDEQLTALKAHFLRLIHPLNSFLVPKRNHVNYQGLNIGEEKELLLYVQDYIKKNFTNEYEEFYKIVRGKEINSSGEKICNIEWFDSPSVSKKKIDNKIDSELVKKSNIKVAKNLKTEQINEDLEEIITESDIQVNLDGWLKSIGKKVFVNVLYPLLLKNRELTVEDIINEKKSEYSDFSKMSQKNRLSSAKSIFEKGLELEALQIIIDSKKVSSEIREKAESFLNQVK